MSGNEHRKIKQQLKRRKRREDAQSKRGSRKVLGMTSDKIEQAINWPVWDCWASQDWHEQGAHVTCCFARRHEDGRVAAVFFELDLAEKGVLEVATRAPTTQANVHAELAKLAGDSPIVGVDPALVVKLVDSARDFGAKQGHSQPSNLARAHRIFGSIRASRSTHEILVGKPDPNAPKSKPSAGWFDGIKRSFGLGS